MTSNEIQKQRIKEIENEANQLLSECQLMFVTSINQEGYPRTCAISKLKANSFHEIYFMTSKRSQKNGKATHFEFNDKASICYQKGHDAVTLIGRVTFITDKDEIEELWDEKNRPFFKKGCSDPKLRIIRFQTTEATFWINHKFRTVKY